MKNEKNSGNSKRNGNREIDGGITLNKFAVAADALECRVFYTFIPKGKSFDDIIEQRALKLANEIIIRTSHTAELENQANDSERNRNALIQRKERIKYEMPRSLWD